MDEIIAFLELGYIFNWMPGTLIMIAADIPLRKWWWLLLPYSFFYFAFKQA